MDKGIKLIINKKIVPKPSVVFDTYWKFAAERQNIFFNKLHNRENITQDPILLKHKFTNAYRASDRVSQFLIREVIYGKGDFTPGDVIFRIILFKIFNKITTWKLLEHEMGAITAKKFDFKNYSHVLSEARDAKESIYSGAYIMTSGKSIFGHIFKHDNHLQMLEKFILNGKFVDNVKSCKSLEKLFYMLRELPTIGSFLAYQYAIDINYSELTDFSEMDFVVAGPGARDGIKKCFKSFGEYSETDIIHWVTDNQEREFERLDLNFRNLWGRRLQLIDCQNLFCETDKYARVAHPEVTGLSERTRIKQIYKKNDAAIKYWFPPKWGINEELE